MTSRIHLSSKHTLIGCFFFKVIVTEANTQFIENVIFVMKSILEGKVEGRGDLLTIANIEPLMLAIVR